MKTNVERMYERLKLTNDMLCNKKFSPILCKKFDYYYVVYGEYTIARCLKQDIREWTLYRLSKED